MERKGRKEKGYMITRTY